jgi:Tol biopolymer transport system component
MVVLAAASAAALSRGAERQIGPDWSRDGRIGLANGVDHLELSPDGRRLALIEYGESGFSPVLLVEGRRTRQLTPDGIHVSAFTWLTDTTLLVAEAEGDIDRLTVFDVDGDRVRPIELDRPLRVTGGMAVSPDRSTLALGADPPGHRGYFGDPELLVFDLATGRLVGDWGNLPRRRYHPEFVDNQRLVFADGAASSVDDGPSLVMYLLDLSDGSSRVIHEPTLGPNTPVLHPDGDLVITNVLQYSAGGHAIGGVDLWALPLDGGPAFLVMDLPDGQIGTAMDVEADGDHLIRVEAARFNIDLVREALDLDGLRPD